MFEDKALAEKVNAAADQALHEGPATPNEKEHLKEEGGIHTERLASAHV